eukprot:589888-Lingulodinium_polyedra.AAC.1
MYALAPAAGTSPACGVVALPGRHTIVAPAHVLLASRRSGSCCGCVALIRWAAPVAGSSRRVCSARSMGSTSCLQ